MNKPIASGSLTAKMSRIFSSSNATRLRVGALSNLAPSRSQQCPRINKPKCYSKCKQIYDLSAIAYSRFCIARRFDLFIYV